MNTFYEFACNIIVPFGDIHVFVVMNKNNIKMKIKGML